MVDRFYSGIINGWFVEVYEGMECVAYWWRMTREQADELFYTLKAIE